MTAGEIITNAKALARQNGTTLDATALIWLNRIQRTYARKEDWPQLRVLNAVLTTSVNTGAYDLPATFDRLMGNTVLFNATAITGGYQDGTPVQVLHSGDPRLDTVINTWYGVGGTATPVVAAVSSKSGAPGTLQLNFYPFPTVGSQTVLYSYYRQPTALVSGTSIDVLALGDAFTMALAAEYERYANQLERAADFRKQERMEYNAVLSTLLPT